MDSQERLLHGFLLPGGEIQNIQSGHPVDGGWLTQSAWDKLKSNNDDELTPEEKRGFAAWQLHYQEVQAKKKIVDGDVRKLRNCIERRLSGDTSLVVARPTRTANSLVDFGVQCLLLSMFPRFSMRPTELKHEEWALSELGLGSIHDLYPLITYKEMLFLIDDLVFNFGYGPNYFNWRMKHPFRLMGVPSTLYLVSIDIGGIMGKDTELVWKTGITKKKVVGDTSSVARFHGPVASHVNVLRQKRYRDSRDSFMIEQSILRISREETALDLKQNQVSRQKNKTRDALVSFDRKIYNLLASSECIFPFRNEEEVIMTFDRMTSYGEFHGDGGSAYSLFADQRSEAQSSQLSLGINIS